MTQEERQRVGKRLRSARAEKGLTQQQVAHHPRVRIAVGTLQGIEAGTRETRESKIEKVAKFFGTTVSQLRQADEVAPTDALLVGLRPEHLRIAHAYKNAESDERELARAILVGRLTAARVIALRRVLQASDGTVEAVMSFVQQVATGTTPTTVSLPPKVPAK